MRLPTGFICGWKGFRPNGTLQIVLAGSRITLWKCWERGGGSRCWLNSTLVSRAAEGRFM